MIIHCMILPLIINKKPKNTYMKLPYILRGSAIAAILATSASAQTIPNNSLPNLVLGQLDFTMGVGGTGPAALANPSSVVVDPTSRKVFVSDGQNSRILRYASADDLENGTPPEAVLGRPSFSTTTSLIRETTVSLPNVSSPGGLFFDSRGRLWVADTGNHRVLMFAQASFIDSGSPANKVYGQPDFISIALQGTSQGTMSSPEAVWVDTADRLWVADTGNGRVLRYDSISNKSNGAAPNRVLGQPNFTARPPISITVSASLLRNPTGIVVSQSGSLFVAEPMANRVLRFDNAAALPNGAAASAVLGQDDFTSIAPGLSATKMRNPSGLAITSNNTLWVCDFSNSRMLRFDQATTKAIGAEANGILGQPNFDTATLTFTFPAVVSPQAFRLGIPSNSFISTYSMPFIDGEDDLWIPDTGNNRVLRFASVASPVVDPKPVVTKPTLTVVGKLPKQTQKKKITIKGTAADPDGIARVQYNIGTGPLQTATGTTNWEIEPKLKKGKNTINVFATDAKGDKSSEQVIKIKRN